MDWAEFSLLIGTWLRQSALSTWDHDFFAGNLTFPKAQQDSGTGRWKFRWIRMLIETDAPYLAPVPHRGKAQRTSIREGNSAQARRTAPGCPWRKSATNSRNFYNFFQKLLKSLKAKVPPR